jgi:hypothetical protein
MNIRMTAVSAFLIGSIAALPALAQNMKPGLWEIDTKGSTTADPRLRQMLEMHKQQMANMPPEQRKMMEDMMAKHGAGGLTMSPDGGIHVKACITPAMVARNQLPIQQRGNCVHKHSPLVGNAMTMSFTCTNPEVSGEGSATFSGDNAFSMTMQTVAIVNGKKQPSSMSSSGKWLASDCGNIKPVASAEGK